MVAAEHGAALLLTSDPRLVSELVRDRLAPLDALGARLRGAAWPRRSRRGWPSRGARRPSPRGSACTRRPSVTASAACARRSGDTLDDPDARFELDLALRTRAFLGTAAG